MKALLLSALTLAGLPLLAQTSTTTTSTTTSTAPSAAQPSAQSAMAQVMSVLSPAEQTQLGTARQKAMTDNPNLQTEGITLMQKRMALESGTATAADKLAFQKEAQTYSTEVHAAMLKADPTIEPVLQKLEAQAAKLRAQYEGSH